MVAILVFAHGPKSIASIFSVVWYHISNLKLNGEMVLKISRSQVGRTDGRPAFLCPTQTSFTEDNKSVCDTLRWQFSVEMDTCMCMLFPSIRILMKSIDFWKSNSHYLKQMWRSSFKDWRLDNFCKQLIIICDDLSALDANRYLLSGCFGNDSFVFKIEDFC